MRLPLVIALLISSPALAADHLVDCNAGAALAQLQQQANQAQCGDTIRVRGVCEAFGGQLTVSKSCSAGNELRFVKDGSVAQLNASYPDFRNAGNGEWTLSDSGRNEYRSVDTFSSWTENARGHFRHPGVPAEFQWNALVPFQNLGHLRSSEYGSSSTTYAGPGVSYNPTDDRLYIRLDDLDGIESDCGIYNPGDLNPNNTEIEISHGSDGILAFSSSAAHIVWDGIDVIGGRFAVAISDNANDLSILNSRIRGNKVAINARSNISNLYTEGNRLETLAPPWVSWAEQKSKKFWDGTGMIGFNTGDNMNGLTITRSYFDRPFDVMSPAGSGTRNVEFSYNTINTNGDDAWQLGTNGASNFHAFKNVFLRAANTWSRSFSGGSTSVKGSLLFYSNVVDTYNGALKLHSKPTRAGAAGARSGSFVENFDANGAYFAGRDDPGVTKTVGGCFHSKAPHGTHGKSGGSQSVKYYQNTYVIGGSHRSTWGNWERAADSNDVQHLKHNIIIWHSDQPILRDWKNNNQFDGDGNIWYPVGKSSNTDMFKSMPGNYKTLAEYQSAVGRELNSLQTNPQLNNATPGGSYCPSVGGPADQRLVSLNSSTFPGVAGVDYVGAVNPDTCELPTGDAPPPPPGPPAPPPGPPGTPILLPPGT